MAETSQDDADECVEQISVPNYHSKQSQYICHQCKCTSNYADGFHKNESESSDTSQYTCLACLAFADLKESQKSNVLDLILPAIFFTVVLHIFGVYQVVLFAIQLFFLLHLAIWVHEYGHYIANRIIGEKVRLVTLGSGPVLTVIRLEQILITIGIYPSSGSVMSEFKSKTNFRKKYFFMVLAGPMSNLLMAGAAVFYMNQSDQLLSPLVTDLLKLWILINIFLGILNLIPSTEFEGLGFTLNDGALLRKIPSWTDEDINKHIGMAQGVSAEIEFLYGDKDIARAIAIDAIESGQNPQIYSGILATSARTREEFEYAVIQNRKALDMIDQEDEITAMVRNNLAYSAFCLGDASLLEEADKQSQRAMDTLPMSLAVRSTRGSILIASGQYEAGLELVEDERFAIASTEDQASVMCVRALAYDGLGQIEKARQSRETAKRLDPDCMLLNDTIEESKKLISKVF